MSLARINIALKGVTEGQWVLAVRDANLPIRANGKYVGFVNLMKRYADLSLGLPDGKSFNLEYFRQFFQTTTDGTYAILSAKLVAYVLVVYPIVSRRSLGCAYGGRCKLGGCVFCLSLPDQVCSYPEDFLSLCVVFWDLKPTSQFSTGIGAMLAASHVRGHSCVSSLYANRVGKSAPHGVSSFEHLFHAVGASNFNDFDDGSAILKVSITSRGVGDSVHYLPCGFVPPGPLPEITVHSAKTTLMFEVLPVNAFIDKTSLNSFPTADEGLGLSPPKFCESACGDLEPGKVFCASCGYVVKADGHQGRCANFPVVYSKTKARLGDVMHRFDVIVALSAQGIHGPAQTQLIADLVSAKEQRAFMLHGNHALESEPLATVSTRFECHYLDFRSRYLSFAFPRVPPSTFAYDFPVVNVDGSVAVGSSSTQVGSPTGGPLAGPSVSDSDSSYEDASESFVIGGASSADVENDRAEIRAKISALKAVSGDSATARDRILIYEQELRRLGKVFRSLKRSGR